MSLFETVIGYAFWAGMVIVPFFLALRAEHQRGIKEGIRIGRRQRRYLTQPPQNFWVRNRS